jgi:hypothetical protein
VKTSKYTNFKATVFFKGFENGFRKCVLIFKLLCGTALEAYSLLHGGWKTIYPSC